MQLMELLQQLLSVSDITVCVQPCLSRINRISSQILHPCKLKTKMCFTRRRQGAKKSKKTKDCWTRIPVSSYRKRRSGYPVSFACILQLVTCICSSVTCLWFSVSNFCLTRRREDAKKSKRKRRIAGHRYLFRHTGSRAAAIRYPGERLITGWRENERP